MDVWVYEWKLLSHVQLFGLHGLYSLWNSPGQNIGVGSLSVLQGIFTTQGLNPGLPYCRQILSQLSHKGSPRILEWVAYPFSSGSPQPRIEPGFPALPADSLPTELWGKQFCVYWDKNINIDKAYNIWIDWCWYLPTMRSSYSWGTGERRIPPWIFSR